MSQFYSDPKRESDPGALPDMEAFHRTVAQNRADNWVDAHDHEPFAAGWYWWACFPGCLPDSESSGPFDTEDAAIADARSY